MGKITSHQRRYLIAAAACLALGGVGFGALLVSPALGPIAGTMIPQLYVDTLPNARIPVQGRYVLVDAASARLYMIEDGRVRNSMKVIVGKPDTPTPELHSVINYETLNPYWHVSTDLAQSLIAANVLKQGIPYLTSHGYEILSEWGPNARVIPPESINWQAVAAGEQKIHRSPAPWAGQLPGPVQVRPSERRWHLPSRYAEEGIVRTGSAQPQPRLRAPRGCAEAGNAGCLARTRPRPRFRRSMCCCPSRSRSPSATSTPAAR